MAAGYGTFYRTPWDFDDDGILDQGGDNCVYNSNPDQLDTDGDSWGDACDGDDDNDGVMDEEDNCDLVVNPEQKGWLDSDELGDACDPCNDNDGDMVCESGVGFTGEPDNCQSKEGRIWYANTDQSDIDGDGVGDACDFDNTAAGHEPTCTTESFWSTYMSYLKMQCGAPMQNMMAGGVIEPPPCVPFEPTMEWWAGMVAMGMADPACMYDFDNDGFGLANGDCDLFDAQFNPLADDTTCDSLDQDCSGVADDHYLAQACPGSEKSCIGQTVCTGGVESCVAPEPTVFHADLDGDGFGNPDGVWDRLFCIPDTGFVASADDCDDWNKMVNPGARDRCRQYGGIEDMNCDGASDSLDCDDFCSDADGDSFAAAEGPEDWDGLSSFICPWVVGLGDCDDSHPGVYPGAKGEVWGSGVDRNCDGRVCGPKKDYAVGVECLGTPVVVNSMAELAAYEENFGFQSSSGKYSGLRINFNPEGDNLQIHSPCKIDIVKGVEFQGGDICIDGRMGVQADNGTASFAIHGSRVALLSELGNAYLSAGSTADAKGQMLIGAGQRAHVGANAMVAVAAGGIEEPKPPQLSLAMVAIGGDGSVFDKNDGLRLLSIGKLPTSDVRIEQGAQVSVVGGQLTMNGVRTVGIDKSAVVKVPVAEITTKGEFNDSKIDIGAAVLLEAKTITMQAILGSVEVSQLANINASGKMFMEAASQGACKIHQKAIVTAPYKSGNCFGL